MYVRRRTCCTDDCIKLVWTFMLIHDWEVISCDLFRFIFNPSFESKRKLISWKNINLRFYRRTPFLRLLNKYYKNFLTLDEQFRLLPHPMVFFVWLFSIFILKIYYISLHLINYLFSRYVFAFFFYKSKYKSSEMKKRSYCLIGKIMRKLQTPGLTNSGGLVTLWHT